MRVKYRVTLNDEEREQLVTMIGSGKAAARKLQHARILLKADQAPGGPAWTDEQMITALDVSICTIRRVRYLFVEEGLDAALNRKMPTGRQFRKLDGAQEARLIAVACSKPPEGRVRWTLNLLADKLVELNVVESISGECVRNTLKKMSLSLG
jgi:transposase